MARIAGVDLPREKRVEIGLTYVYGIGRKLSNEILKKAGINPDTRVKDLTEAEEIKLREVIHDYTVEGDLRREVALNIKRLVEMLNVVFGRYGTVPSTSLISGTVEPNPFGYCSEAIIGMSSAFNPLSSRQVRGIKASLLCIAGISFS